MDVPRGVSLFGGLGGGGGGGGGLFGSAGGLFGAAGGAGGAGGPSVEEKFATLISDDIKSSLDRFIKKRKLEKKVVGDAFFLSKFGMSSADLLSKFQGFNNQLLDKSVDIEEKKKIIVQVKEILAQSIESSSLAIKCGIFFGLAVLSKNVKTDEATLEGILQILTNLTAGNTEDFTILVNEGAQALVIENLDKTLPDNICEGAIWCVANLAVESAQATELLVTIDCFDRVIDVYLSKLDSKLYQLTSTTAWCIASFLHHNKLNEENRLKLIPVLKGMLEKEHDSKETLDYISYSFNALLTSSRKIVEEMDNAGIFKLIREGFIKLDAKNPADLKLAFYKGVIESMIEDKDSHDILTKYLADEGFISRLCTYAFELHLKPAQRLAKPLATLLSTSKEAVTKFHGTAQSYDRLYQKLREDNNHASQYIKILKLLITRGGEKAHESIYAKENTVDCAYLKTVVRAIPTATHDYETLLDLVKGLIAIIKLAQAKKPDAITNNVKGALCENRNLVKNFLNNQKDADLIAEINSLYELLAMKKDDKIVDEREEKKKKETKKSAPKKDEKDSKLKANLPDEDLPNPLKRKLKRMTTMAQTALEASEFLDKPEFNLRKTRLQTKLAEESGEMEDEEEAKTKKGRKKKISKKKATKLSKAIPDHPAIRRTKTMIETIAAAKAFLKSNEKGRSAKSSLRSATRATKTLRRTRTMKDVIADGKSLQKKYGRGKRVKDDVDYSELFRKKVRK